MRVAFESQALVEYREAAIYSRQRFGLGVEFVDAVESAFATIASAPVQFQEIVEGIRIFRMRRFPFFIFYHFNETGKTFIVYAVAHHSREPGYWMDRLG